MQLNYTKCVVIGNVNVNLSPKQNAMKACGGVDVDLHVPQPRH
jgi:hypothetical protein